MADKGITLEDLTQRFKISSGVLENEVSESDIREISTFLEFWKLVAPYLGLGKGEIEAIENDGKSEKEKRVLMLQRWKQALVFKATYKELINALLSIRRADLAVKVCQMMVPTPLNSQPMVNTQLEDESGGKMPTLAEKLIGNITDIAQWKDLPGKAVARDTAVENFISRSIECGSSLDEIKEQLRRLRLEKLLISKEEVTKALQFADEYIKSKPSHVLLAKDNQPNSPTKDDNNQVDPLFCKDAVYHASLCCRAVSTYDAGNYQKFFKNKDLVPGHSFDAVSFSRSKEENFLVAQKGESTFYFAFQGNPSLTDWAKECASFSEGIASQSKKFPIRFIIELLNKQCRIILTGFSFGGLLASTVAACIWDTHYISSDLLKENMTCITFGQPHVSVEIIERVARRRPKMVSTIHAIFIKDDQVPSLMGLLDECWSTNIQQSQSESVIGVHLSAVAINGQAMPFKDQMTSVLLELFAKLQKDFQSPASTKIMEELKAKLHEVIAIGDMQCLRQFIPTFTRYNTSHEESANGLIISQDKHIVAATQIQSLTAATLYKQHSIMEYSKDIFECYLDKHPKYVFPESKQHALGDVNSLRPSVEGIQIHHHGNQYAVVVEGNNLWFCYQISFRGQKLPIPASEISGSAIHLINVSGKIKMSSSGKESVTLFNYFKSKPIRQDVEVHEKKYSTTTRQEQLAKLTPSQVIELGYLSALLECYQGTTTNSSFSHKFSVIQKFVEDVVKVVPFESIAYAIANGNYQTAMQCASALRTCDTKIPKTVLMYAGLSDANIHLRYGTPADLVQSMKFKALEQVTYPLNQAESLTMYRESEELVYRLYHQFQDFLSPDVSVPLSEVRLDLRSAGIELSNINVHVADDLMHIREKVFQNVAVNKWLYDDGLELVSMSNIEDLYPVHNKSSVLKSPLDILATSRRQLAELSKKPSETCSNKQMLQIVNAIRCNELDTCASLLGGFMHQRVVYIVLSSHNKVQRSGLFLNASASVGVWALFSLDYSHVQPILAKCEGEQLLVKLYDYVKGITGIHHEPDNNEVCPNPYAAKLQFMVQGMTKSVTCNTQHVIYSLERQLVELCKERNINAETSLSTITAKWSVLFKGNTLSLVHHRCRPLIARWLKWALMIHKLREELAKYTAVGVVGLVNSGKSKLVNTLFGIEIPTGTTEGKRTTIPLLYNLEESVEGLDVVDFPGVDDEDDSIGDLADLLLTIAQIIIFVVDYRKAHTQSAKKWLERLQRENVPFLVCLTFGDKLYAEHMSSKGEHPSRSLMTRIIKDQLSEIQGKLHRVGSHQIQFFSFCQNNDSVLNSDSGREKLKEVGIGTPLQVGEWLVKVFRRDFDQDELANQLEPFMHRNVAALC